MCKKYQCSTIYLFVTFINYVKRTVSKLDRKEIDAPIWRHISNLIDICTLWLPYQSIFPFQITDASLIGHNEICM